MSFDSRFWAQRDGTMQMRLAWVHSRRPCFVQRLQLFRKLCKYHRLAVSDDQVLNYLYIVLVFSSIL